jgi:histidinol-phosphate/aromatic aminotransferase/cobyric acid decarboxylase-like protein/choline kinase
MQAIILAAGMGRRLGELTRENTKCMVEVNGVSLIDRLLGQLSRERLERVVIVVGYKGQELKDFIGHRYDGRLKIEYVENPVYDRTNNIYSLALAKEQLQEDDTLLIESDLIFSDRLIPMILENPQPNLALVAKYESWMDGTMVTVDKEGNIVSFVPKKAFNYDNIGLYYKTVNLYKFSREFSRQKYVPFLDAYSRAMGNNEYYEQVLRVITLIDDSGLKALPVGGEKWYEIDDVQDLDIAETIFDEGESLWRNYSNRYGGFWRFPQMLDFNYLVNPYFPPHRMCEELRANFHTLLTEYPSGMGINSLLAGKYFNIKKEYVVPGNGAAELIKAAMELLPGRIGVVYPTFEEYPNRKVKDDIVIFHPSSSDMHYTKDELIDFFSEHHVDTLLIINPDNPSGNFIPLEELHRLIAWCGRQNTRIIVDESFVDFAKGYPHNTLLNNKTLDAHPHLLVMKSISKSYGVPGLRLGVLASADVAIISQIKKSVAIWNINSFAEFYLQIFGKYTADYDYACEQFQKERNRFEQRLREIPFLKVIPTEANFFLCEVSQDISSSQLAVTLLKESNILIKDCAYKKAFQGRNFVRIAVRNQTDNDRLIEALKRLKL